MLTVLLLVVIAWLLWAVKEDLEEISERQRSMKVTIDRLATRLQELSAGRERGSAESGGRAKPDLNGASAAELMRINGIGPALAERIIAGRPYRSFDEVGRVEGISASLLAALRKACILGAE